jgi:hypothetical protein
MSCSSAVDRKKRPIRVFKLNLALKIFLKINKNFTFCEEMKSNEKMAKKSNNEELNEFLTLNSLVDLSGY